MSVYLDLSSMGLSHPMGNIELTPPPAIVSAMANEATDSKSRAAYKMLAASQRANRVRQAQKEKQQLVEVLGEDGLFRFGYVPFVIGELVWDYAETVTNLAALLKLKGARKLSRCIRDLKEEYKAARRYYTSKDGQEGILENMYAFEDAVADIFKTFLLNVRHDLKCEWPDLDKNLIDFLASVYQCHTLIKALELYGDRQERKAAKIVGHPVGKLIPSSIRRLEDVIDHFKGNRPASAKFEELQRRYIEVLAAQMALIKLTPIKE